MIGMVFSCPLLNMKNDDGYNLYIERDWAGKPSLEFPVRLKQGLGIKETNIKWVKN
ncbi:hypothetical protein [Pseudoalteromonas sp. C12FD-1]|uniref:hypothetical protein n=1 Tax=Pseudoalteromonas sp. C12FD-1 TaxID=3131979 RepID=UPI002923FD07|nr:hypothetical protein PspMM1_31940 [Pseudoalteromonas sp. MM1]